jgi:S1-C subfamily serine protease
VRTDAQTQLSGLKKICITIPAVVLLLASRISLAAPPTDGDRAKTLRAVHFDFTPVQTIAAQRCAIAVTGVRADQVKTDSDSNPDFETNGRSITVKISGAANGVLIGALAVAIDKRGYFLTAAHVVNNPPVNLIFLDGQQMRVEAARVVASSPKKSKSNIDLAILRVPVDLCDSFDWAEAPNARAKDVAFEIGSREISWTETSLTVGTALFAGGVKRIIQYPAGGCLILTDLPTREGDSGGPLFNSSGQLLGVLSGTTRRTFFRRPISVITRPDTVWVGDSIKADQQKQPPEIATPDKAEYSGETVHLIIQLLPTKI